MRFDHKLLLDKRPKIHPTAYVAPTAVIIGDVELQEESSVWFHCVLRGDVNYIRVGKGTNIQDLTVCHGLIKTNPVIIGNNVTVGHSALVHACVVEDECLIGMGAILLTGSKIGEQSIVAAGAVVREGQEIPPRSLVVGVPAKVKRTLTDEEIQLIKIYGANYDSYRRTYNKLDKEVRKLLEEFWSNPRLQYIDKGGV